MDGELTKKFSVTLIYEDGAVKTLFFHSYEEVLDYLLKKGDYFNCDFLISFMRGY